MTRAGGRRVHAKDSGTGRWGAALAVAAVVTALVLGGAGVISATTSSRDASPAAQDSASSAPPTVERDRVPTPSAEPKRAKPVRPHAPIRAAAPMVASEPARLEIPALDVDVDVMDLGLTDRGVLEVPQGAYPAGWYTGSPTPGELGPAIVAGHVTWNGTDGVFLRLHELARGDHVLVTRTDGSVADFTVSETEQYAKDAFPTATVYGDIDHAGLRLITCGGLDPDSGVFEDNVVVFAELTDS